MPYGTTCIYIWEWSGKPCGEPADFGIPWRDDDSGTENAAWYCLPHFKEMQAADNMRLLLSAHIAAMPFDECE